MSREVRYTLPLPARNLSPNRSRHWAVRHGAKVAYTYDSMIAAMQARRANDGISFERARVRLIFRTGGDRRDGGYRPKDVDNAEASCKALIDGLVQAQVIPDDAAHYLAGIDVEIIPESPPGVEVVVTELENEHA